MLVVVLDLHVLVELILSIELSIDSLPVEGLELVASHNAGTFSLPLVHLTILAYG